MRLNSTFTALASCLLIAPAWAQQSTALWQQAPQTMGLDGKTTMATLTPDQRTRLEQQNTLHKKAADSLSGGDYEGAESYARQSLAQRQDDVVAMNVLARALSAEGKTAEAIQTYRALVYPQGRWVTTASESADVLMPYALLLLKTGRWPEAVAAYRMMRPAPGGGALPKVDLQFDPAAPKPAALAAAAHVVLGLCDYDEGNIGDGDDERAFAEFQQALQLAPDWDIANLYYAFGLWRLHRIPEAKAAFAKAAQMGGPAVKQSAANFAPFLR